MKIKMQNIFTFILLTICHINIVYAVKSVEPRTFLACPGDVIVLGSYTSINAKPMKVCVEIDSVYGDESNIEFWTTGIKNKDLGFVSNRACFDFAGLKKKLKAGEIKHQSYIYVTEGLYETRPSVKKQPFHKDGLDPCKAICLQKKTPSRLKWHDRFACGYTCNENERGVNSEWKFQCSEGLECSRDGKNCVRTVIK